MSLSCLYVCIYLKFLLSSASADTTNSIADLIYLGSKHHQFKQQQQHKMAAAAVQTRSRISDFSDAQTAQVFSLVFGASKNLPELYNLSMVSE